MAMSARLPCSTSTLGRLLFVDPTNRFTPVGELPESDQDSFALIVAGSAGALVKAPATAPFDNRTERQTEATLAADGSISAAVRDRYFGSSAVSERRAFHDVPRPEYVKDIEARVSGSAPGASVSKIEPEEGAAPSEFKVNLEFTAPMYGRSMRGNLLIFKPAILERHGHLAFTEPTRKYPIVLHSHAFTETARIKLPPGFKVDELPGMANLEASFGKYHATWEVKGNELVFTRALEIQNAIIPPERYAEVRSFYEHMIGAEQSPVVLVR